MARRCEARWFDRGRFRARSTRRAGQRAPGSVWVYRSARLGFDPRRCAVHSAAGAGDDRGRAAPLKTLKTGPAGVRRQATQPSILGGNKNKERNLGGQNCPAAEEDSSDWRAFERGGGFAGGPEGSRGAACGKAWW